MAMHLHVTLGKEAEGMFQRISKTPQNIPNNIMQCQFVIEEKPIEVWIASEDVASLLLRHWYGLKEWLSAMAFLPKQPKNLVFCSFTIVDDHVRAWIEMKYLKMLSTIGVVRDIEKILK